MNLETRVENLESLVNSLVEMVGTDKFYTDASIAGVQKSVSDINEEMFPEWNSDGYNYYVSERVSYNGVYYRCIQSHKSQPSWAPDVAVSLWVSMDDPAIEWPEWKQPVGAQDAYMAGAKVSHNDKHWTSDVDNNVWEPGVYGWTEVN